MKKLVALCGSLAAQSQNGDLILNAKRRAPLDCEITWVELPGILPLFNPDLEKDGTPHVVQAFRTAMSAADALLIASPEYGHSLPGALKNAIDWLIPSGELVGTPVAITCAVAHPERGLRGLEALKITLLAADALVVFCQPIVQDASAAHHLDRLLMTLSDAVDTEGSVHRS